RDLVRVLAAVRLLLHRGPHVRPALAVRRGDTVARAPAAVRRRRTGEPRGLDPDRNRRAADPLPFRAAVAPHPPPAARAPPAPGGAGPRGAGGALPPCSRARAACSPCSRRI